MREIMVLSTQPYKGTRDFYPQDKRLQKWMFDKMREVVESFGYQEYDAPVLEPIDIFLAKTGEEIIDEQLYSFEDRGGRQVAIRPEMTPSVSRMVAARRQELAYPLRWYSIPNLWRYERPQRGRLREHWQLNVDIFGVADISADHEIILVADSILRAFNAPNGSYEIRISSRQLVDYFFRNILQLSDQQYHDASKLIDRWHKIEIPDFETQLKEIVDGRGQERLLKLIRTRNLDDLLSEVKGHDSVTELKKLMSLLKKSGVEAATFDFSVIRGMDYYDDIIFEVFDTSPQNNRSMFGGGRYDGLVGAFGVEPVPTVGFGMGDVTLQNFLELHKLLPKLKSETDAVVILIGGVYDAAQKVLSTMRAKGLRIAVDGTDRKLDAKIKNAAKSGMKYAIFIGEQEIKTGKFKLKNLESGDEKNLGIEEVVTEIS
ncbi:histidine--tRNA ligase [Candidatus Saccharibacteria bacterium]|nr:histidine--tRNA ligase [Candidatus Saccharibacteria bacterium]